MIDINSPDFFAATTAAVNQYSSPEAAQKDFQDHAPQALDLYTKKYQALTGDPFSDPFADQIKSRDATLMNSIVSSRVAPAIGPTPNTPGGVANPLSINVGGQNGPTINPASQVIAQRNLIDAIKGPADTTTQDTNRDATLSHPMYQFDNSQATSLPGTFSKGLDRSDLATQKRRAAAFGVTDIFDKLASTNPDALKRVDTTDQALQLDKTGKPVSGDTLNAKLYNDPNFQHLLTTDPTKAHKVYQALNDRNLAQDLTMQRAANDKRTATRDTVLKDLHKNLIFDDITGEPQLRTYQKDQASGEMIEGKPRALSAVEQHAIQQEGGFKSIYGYDPPKGMGLNPDQTNALRGEQSRIMGANPSIPKAVALLQARKNLADRNTVPAAAPLPSKIHQAGDFFTTLAQGVNDQVEGQINKTAAGLGLPDIPHGDVTTIGDYIGRGASGAVDAGGNVLDWLKEKAGNLDSSPPNLFARPQTVATW